MSQIKKKEADKKKSLKKGKGKYHEKIKVDASFTELLQLVANGKKK